MKPVAILTSAFALTALAGSASALAAPSTDAASSAQRASLRVAERGDLGRVVVLGSGRAVYEFARDPDRRSTCSGYCTIVWRPVLTGAKARAGAGISARRIGTITRRDGRRQVTYGGRALYTYDQDRRAGQTRGQGVREFGARWFMLDARARTVRGRR